MSAKSGRLKFSQKSSHLEHNFFYEKAGSPSAGKPIGLCCIAPVLAAGVLGSKVPNVCYSTV
jgi:hypothetical protein